MNHRILPKNTSVRAFPLGVAAGPLLPTAVAAGVNLIDAGIVGTTLHEKNIAALGNDFPGPAYILSRAADDLATDRSGWLAVASAVAAPVSNPPIGMLFSLGALDKARLDMLKSGGVLDILGKARAEGRLAGLGFFHGGAVEDLEAILEGFSGFDFCCLRHNYLDDASAKLDVAGEKALGVIVFSPFAGGRLVAADSAVKRAFASYGRPRMAAEWALRFSLDRQEVLCALPACSSESHLWENVATASALLPNSLTEKERAVLDKARALI